MISMGNGVLFLWHSTVSVDLHSTVIVYQLILLVISSMVVVPYPTQDLVSSTFLIVRPEIIFECPRVVQTPIYTLKLFNVMHHAKTTLNNQIQIQKVWKSHLHARLWPPEAQNCSIKARIDRYKNSLYKCMYLVTTPLSEHFSVSAKMHTHGRTGVLVQM